MDVLEAGLVARDLPALETFYVRAMGFSVVDRLVVPEFGTVVRLRRGDALLKLYAPTGALDGRRADDVARGVDPDGWYRPGGWRYAALRLAGPDVVDGLVTAVTAAGGRMVLAPRSHRPGASVAVVADPEGNVWELLADRADADERADRPSETSI